jgi:hypothetical protein
MGEGRRKLSMRKSLIRPKARKVNVRGKSFPSQVFESEE